MPRRWPMVAVMATMVLATTGCTITLGSPGVEPTTPTPGPTSSPSPDPTEEPSPDPTEDRTDRPTPPAGEPTELPDALTYSFVSVLRDKMPEVATGRSDEELQVIADTLCTALARGLSSEDITDAARRFGSATGQPVDYATANEMIKLAIDTSCPGQAPRVTEF